jgi:16S rRNA (adenine1518-N6/adenine1519-N6)-dimethyltransferase
VDSSIVRLIPHQAPPVEVKDFALFEKLVSGAFAQRRKTLRNTLKDWLSEQQWQAAGVDPQRRAETLSLEEFARLAQEVEKG